MKKLLAYAISSLLFAAPAFAETAGEKFDKEGFAGFTNFEVALGNELRRAGVPEDCMMKMPMSSVREIAALATGEGDTPETREKIKVRLEKVCGDLDLN